MSIYHEIDGETARAIEKHREDTISGDANAEAVAKYKKRKSYR